MADREPESAGADVVVFGDYSCPFCYVAESALRRLLAAGVGVERRAFELRPAPAPIPDPETHRHRQRFERVVLPLAERAGLAIRMPRYATRTRKAHEAAAYAREHGELEAMHAAIFHAHFVEGRDIGRIDVLVAIGESVGLDRSGLKVALDIDQYTASVEADEALAASLGITAMPAFVRGDGSGDVVFGVREPGLLRRWLIEGTGERRTR